MDTSEIEVLVSIKIRRLLGPFLVLITAVVDNSAKHRQIMLFGETIFAWKVE
jgi:hypothetical protein